MSKITSFALFSARKFSGRKVHGLSNGHFPISFVRNAFASTQVRCTGKLPKRPKGSDCKSAVIDFVGSNPSLATKENPAITGNKR